MMNWEELFLDVAYFTVGTSTVYLKRLSKSTKIVHRIALESCRCEKVNQPGEFNVRLFAGLFKCF